MEHTTALLIIDAQVNMFDEKFPAYRAEIVLQNLQALLQQARKAAAPVVFVQNNGGPDDPDKPGTPGWFIHPALASLDGEISVQKTTPDSFHQTGLKQKLDELQVNRLVIAGLQTDFCVNATTRRAAELGYEVVLVEDAHSTYDGKSQTAQEVIDQYNLELGKVVTLRKTGEVVF